LKIDKKGILAASIFNGRNHYLKNCGGEITFEQILVIPNFTCPLKCRHCAAGNQYARRKNFDSKVTVDDFDKLLSVCKTKQANIQGGEVFVNPHIAEFFDLFSQMTNIENCASVAVFTNATVIPSDAALNAYSKINLPKTLMISNYNLQNVKIDAFVSKAAEFGLEYVVFPKDRYWLNPGDPRHETGFSESELIEVVKRCTAFTRKPKIIDGKFFACGQNAYALYENLSDFVDIRMLSTSELKQELYDYMFNRQTYDICKYCYGQYDNCEKVAVAEQLK
jgi:hypothetical protein